MKIKDLIKKLADYNPEAEVSIIAHYTKFDFSITIGGAEGITKKTTKEVSFYVDKLNVTDEL